LWVIILLALLVVRIRDPASQSPYSARRLSEYRTSLHHPIFEIVLPLVLLGRSYCPSAPARVWVGGISRLNIVHDQSILPIRIFVAIHFAIR
jgi:hypothetical protein